MPLPADVHEWSALDLSRAVRTGEVSCTEVTRHHLRRSAALGPVVGAFAHLDHEQALAQAAEIDRRTAAGDVPPAAALWGCPAPVKDLDPVAGMPCAYGSRAFAGRVATEDAAFVSRMRAGGLVITGKTTTPEFGLPAYTENDLGHTARTPWDLERSAGGSSGGAAAAVAARLAPVAQGSDGGGSIRIPASVTGLVGIKPSRGRVSDLPLPPGIGELGVVGPLARTVADAAAFLDVLAGSGPADLFGLPPQPPGTFLAATSRPPAPLTVGRCTTPMVVDTEIHPEALRAVDRACDLMADLGHEVVVIDRPVGPQVVPAFEAIWWVGAAAIPVPAAVEGLLTPLTRDLRERGRRLTGVDVARAVHDMRTAAVTALQATADFDVIVTPTLASLPVPVGHFTGRHPQADFAAQKEFTPFTSPFNVTGQPAMSVPLHHTDRGLPVGVQLVGRPQDEVTIIALAAQLEDRVRWHERIPPDPGSRDG